MSMDDTHVIDIAERDEIPSLQTPVQFMPGVGPARAVLLERLELKTGSRLDRKSTRLNSSHSRRSRMPSSA